MKRVELYWGGKMDSQDICENLVRFGKVKWFDTKKDYGFIVPTEGGTDVLLHGNVLRSFGQSSILKGAEVSFEIHETDQGPQTTKIISQTLPDHVDAHVDEEIESIPLLPARVKWFDHKRGFGFAQVFGNRQDVLIHRVVLNRSCLDDIIPGEAISIRCDETDRGTVAVQVLAWARK